MAKDTQDLADLLTILVDPSKTTDRKEAMSPSWIKTGVKSELAAWILLYGDTQIH